MTFPPSDSPSDPEDRVHQAESSDALVGHDAEVLVDPPPDTFETSPPISEETSPPNSDAIAPADLSFSSVAEADDSLIYADGSGVESRVYAARATLPPSGRGMKRARHIAMEVLQTLVLAVFIFLAVRTVAQNFRVEGSSMEPGLHDGQYLLVNKAVYFKINLATLGKYLPFIDGGDRPERFLFGAPSRGDIVVFRFPRDPDRDFIKRIIGLPGDTVEVVDGSVFVNGVLTDDSYANSETRSDFDKQVVPPGNYFVLGDNRGNSSDSRSWGFVPEENLIGKAMFSYWPLGNLGGVGNRNINLGFVTIPLP